MPAVDDAAINAAWWSGFWVGVIGVYVVTAVIALLVANYFANRDGDLRGLVQQGGDDEPRL